MWIRSITDVMRQHTDIETLGDRDVHGEDEATTIVQQIQLTFTWKESPRPDYLDHMSP